jgi:hypothetical protein
MTPERAGGPASLTLSLFLTAALLLPFRAGAQPANEPVSTTLAPIAGPADTPVQSADTAAGSMAGYEITAPGLILRLSADGEISGTTVGKIDRAARGRAYLADCVQEGATRAEKSSSGAVSFTRALRHRSGQTCWVTERFSPTKTSIRWELVVVSAAADPWTTPLALELRWPATEKTRFWTAWDNGNLWDDPTAAPGDLASRIPDGDAWGDPLVPMPLTNDSWNFGPRPLMDDSDTHPNDKGSICIPIASVLEPATDTGLSLIVAPDQPLLWLRLETATDGTLRFQHNLLRLGGGRRVGFEADIVAHEADWRGGLRWMTGRYARYFDPPNPNVGKMGGTASYSRHRGPLEPSEMERLKRMAYRCNWVASFDWPYCGMFLPPAPRWKSAGHDTSGRSVPGLVRDVSYLSMDDDYRERRTHGFFTLNYFNVTEFGSLISGPAAVRRDLAERDWWTDANTYLFRRMPDAVVGPNLIYSWSGSVVMDPGVASFQEHLLEQAQRHIDRLPDADGIAIDQMLWLAHVNLAPGADDGVGWYAGGRPGRLLGLGWIDLLGKLGPLMHRAGKVIFVNSQHHRLDYMPEVDGIFDEYGDRGYALNGSSLLALRKPALMWTHSADSIRPDPDSFFQRHLHMGAFPTAPFPGNDHAITPEPDVDRHYLDYGPLFDAIRGKKWVLAPHCVEVAGGRAKANLFEIPGGYALPVTFAGRAKAVTVRVRNVPGLDRVRAGAWLPGCAAPEAVRSSFKDGILELTVPVGRGCSLVRISAERTGGR